MKLEVAIDIDQPKEVIWKAITDIENCSDMISSIVDLTILEKPENGLVGLKWKETRVMFGKTATEVMWITDAVENEYYYTRAESHGSVYITRLALDSAYYGYTKLSMSFVATSESIFVKVISKVMGFFLKKSMTKALYKDMQDIKEFVESN